MLKKKFAGCPTIDWSKFVDSDGREVRGVLTKNIINVRVTTQAGRGWISAENRLMDQARYRYSRGRAAEQHSTTTGSGYFQGQRYSFVIEGEEEEEEAEEEEEEEANCEPQGFVDDSSMSVDGTDPGDARPRLRGASQMSLDLERRTGTNEAEGRRSA